MSRELWSQSGEPTWAIDERLRRLEVRVNQLAAVVAELVRAQAADRTGAAAGEVRAAEDPGRVGPSGRVVGVGQPSPGTAAPRDGGGVRGGAS